MTSAPSHASASVHEVPASNWVRSRTFTSSSAVFCDMLWTLLLAALTSGCDGFVCLEEAPRVLHDFVVVFLRILPGIDAYLAVRREAGHLYRDLLPAPGQLVRRHQ